MKALSDVLGIVLLVALLVFMFDPIKIGHNARLVYDSFHGWAPCVEDSLACFRTGDIKKQEAKP